jgi:hypothetical protein
MTRYRQAKQQVSNDHGQPLTALDLAELERMLCESGVVNPEHLAKAKAESEGL